MLGPCTSRRSQSGLGNGSVFLLEFFEEGPELLALEFVGDRPSNKSREAASTDAVPDSASKLAWNAHGEFCCRLSHVAFLPEWESNDNERVDERRAASVSKPLDAFGRVSATTS